MTIASNFTIRLEDLASWYEAKLELWLELAEDPFLTDDDIEDLIADELDWESYLT